MERLYWCAAVVLVGVAGYLTGRRARRLLRKDDLIIPVRNGVRSAEVRQLSGGRCVYYVDVGDAPPEEVSKHLAKFRATVQ